MTDWPTNTTFLSFRAMISSNSSWWLFTTAIVLAAMSDSQLETGTWWNCNFKEGQFTSVIAPIPTESQALQISDQARPESYRRWRLFTAKIMPKARPRWGKYFRLDPLRLDSCDSDLEDTVWNVSSSLDWDPALSFVFENEGTGCSRP